MNSVSSPHRGEDREPPRGEAERLGELGEGMQEAPNFPEGCYREETE